MIGRLLAVPLLIWLLGFAVFAVTLPGPDEKRVAGEVAVVFTGGPGRIARALDDLGRGRVGQVFVSGVAREVTAKELAAEYRAPVRLFDCCVTLGRDAADTRGNATESARWLRKRRVPAVRLVTTDWHMPRAAFELRRELGRTPGAPLPVRADGVRSSPSLWALFSEYNKYALRRVAVLVEDAAALVH